MAELAPFQTARAALSQVTERSVLQRCSSRLAAMTAARLAGGR
ncbi:MAG TPA: hypothetical protein VIA62_21600 [Thermoanaerobaculia bacterium]|nr:hypothetical protein [Thermoanaerobaculia bacterium]